MLICDLWGACQNPGWADGQRQPTKTRFLNIFSPTRQRMKCLVSLFSVFVFSLFFHRHLSAQADCACCTSAHEQFDFWVGHWMVMDTTGQLLGTNTITKQEDNCILAERWIGLGGTTGRSMNYYNAVDSSWNQVWVDNAGNPLVLKGKGQKDKMVLCSQLQQSPGGAYYSRVTWTKQPDWTVHQVWEILSHQDSLLSTVFYGIYQRKERLTAQQILGFSRQFHDPNGSWDTTKLELHIREPRTTTPERQSTVTIDNKAQSFELIRNRPGGHVSTHRVFADGKTETLWNGEATQDTALIRQFRLDPNRNHSYFKFYRFMYGLPMSLQPSDIRRFGRVAFRPFNGSACIKIPITLAKPMISNSWVLYFDQLTLELKGIEILSANNGPVSERLAFSEIIEYQGLKIPRIRNWTDPTTDKTTGTDIIVNKQ